MESIRQAQVGDLAGAPATLGSGKGSEGIIAPMLAWQGNVELALNLIQNSGSSEDTKAVAHSGVALQLAWRGDLTMLYGSSGSWSRHRHSLAKRIV